MSFTHLQVRSGYSFFNSTITIDKLVDFAQQNQCRALALTDEEVLYGVIPFYKACVARGIKPLIGMAVQIPFNEDTLSVILLAKNNQGYKNLLHISTERQLHGTVTSDLTDVLCIISLETQPLKQMLVSGEFDALHELLSTLQREYKMEELYLGIEIYEQHQGVILMENGKQFEQTYGIPFVALQDVRYLEEKDVLSYDCLQAMKFNEKWNLTTPNKRNQKHHFRTEDEMRQVFSAWKELVDRTNDIAEKCQVTFDFDRKLLPAFPVPTGENSTVYLRRLCEEALSKKYDELTDTIKNRLAYELEIIERLGYSDYFLIVADFIAFARNNNILVGPGRGSAAGSIVAYLLGITNVDPIAYDLLFERFLNPERVTMPDIDVDFSDVRREEVIQYVREKYGQEHVAQIVTFGTFAARSLLRELMKTMEIHQHDQNYILKQISTQANKPLVHYIQSNKEFEKYIKQSNKLTMLFFIAVKLEGLPRHISTHAAGIVISKDPLIHDVPLIKGTDDTYLTQYAMNEVEAVGLLKFDLLGLRNLSLMERIIQTIHKKENVHIDINNLPLQDEKTFNLLRAGRTNGIFQLESSGMKNVLVNLQPTTIEDIVALNALYRPGPMEQIPTYINRKHGREETIYIHPDLEPILNKTYGVLVYQEQIMQIAHQFAGLSLGEADILRRAVSKKDQALIETQREAFLDGCKKKGYDVNVAEEIFSWIVKFANYGFNKSHSVAYSKIAYQLSYLKANYPTYFFAQLLNSFMGDGAKINMYVREAQSVGIEILPPSINKSFAYYTVENKHIRIGLMAIKGIGYDTVQTIIDARKKGPFTDLFNFCFRVTLRRKTIETLILAGAFDETYDNRASLLASIDQALDRAELFGDSDGQNSLFPEAYQMEPAYVEIDDFLPMQKLNDEKELLQMYVSSHPLKRYRTTFTIRNYITLHTAKNLREKSPIKSVVIIQQMRSIYTKRGDTMAFITMSDETEEMEGVIFPSVFREVSHWLKEEMVVYIEGKVNTRNNQKQVIVDKVSRIDLDELESNYMYIRLTKETMNDANDYLKSVAQQFPGPIEIIVYHEVEKKTYKLAKDFRISGDKACLERLYQYFGQGHVVLKQ